MVVKRFRASVSPRQLSRRHLLHDGRIGSDDNRNVSAQKRSNGGGITSMTWLIGLVDNQSQEGFISGNGPRSPRQFSAKVVPFLVSAAVLASPAMAADNSSPIPDLAGRWGRDVLFLE